jgi:hypothetical protein
MKISWKTAVAALALTAGATAALPASAQSFGLGFGPRGGINFSYDSGGYCDQFGCPDNFWDMPVYYGPVFWRGDWYDGPVYYREAFGHRQFWIHGDWRNDEWRGPHPGWWREGRYGPPLGVDYYRSHGFHGRWDRGGFDRRDDHRDFDRRGDDRGFDRRDDHGDRGERGGFNRNDDRGNRGPAPMDQRGAPQPQGQPQQQRERGGPGNNPAPPGFQGRGDGTGYGHYDNPPTSPAPAAAPAAPPAAPPGGASPGDRHHDH